MVVNLSEARNELGMTQLELGLILGVDNTTVCGWETNKDTMPLFKLVRFCNLFTYNIDYIVGLERRNKNFETIPRLDSKKIGKKLKEWRKLNKFTQERIAKECMVSISLISQYENGKYLITGFNLYTLCKIHKISMYYFLRD